MSCLSTAVTPNQNDVNCKPKLALSIASAVAASCGGAPSAAAETTCGPSTTVRRGGARQQTPESAPGRLRRGRGKGRKASALAGDGDGGDPPSGGAGGGGGDGDWWGADGGGIPERDGHGSLPNVLCGLAFAAALQHTAAVMFDDDRTR